MNLVYWKEKEKKFGLKCFHRVCKMMMMMMMLKETLPTELVKLLSNNACFCLQGKNLIPRDPCQVGIGRQISHCQCFALKSDGAFWLVKGTQFIQPPVHCWTCRSFARISSCCQVRFFIFLGLHVFRYSEIYKEISWILIITKIIRAYIYLYTRDIPPRNRLVQGFSNYGTCTRWYYFSCEYF